MNRTSSSAPVPAPDPAASVRRLSERTLPRWNELPDLDLYMDQLLEFVSRALADAPGFDEKGLTASMVNNYVKAGVLPAPLKKRYTRSHLARLIVVCVLKPVLSLGAIRSVLTGVAALEEEAARYDRFCALYEEAGRAAAEAAREAVPAGADADPPKAPSPTGPIAPAETAASREKTGAAAVHAALRAQSEQALALSLLASI